LKGQSIFGCPFKVNSEQTSGANQEASAKFSTASGAGLTSATTIAPADFTVQAKNKFGNNLTKGGNDVKVEVKGPRGSAPVVASVKDNNDGTYSISYQVCDARVLVAFILMRLTNDTTRKAKRWRPTLCVYLFGWSSYSSMFFLVC